MNDASLRRVSLVLLRPHALEAGQGAPIVRHLAQRLDARPVAIRVYPRLGPAVVGALYASQAKVPRGSMWLQEAAFGSGPAAALLVASERPHEPSLTEALYALKGPSSTLEPAPDSLRARFGRTSSLHAVLHVPEDERSLAAEAPLFFDRATIAGAADAPRLCSDLVETLVTLEPAPGRSVFQAVLKVKLRVLAAVAIAAGRDAVAALQDLTASADAQLDGRDYLDQRDLMLAFAQAERAPLEEAVTRVGGGLLTASRSLSGHVPAREDGGEALFAVLEAGGIPLSASQRSLLATGLALDLNPAARSDGARLWPLGPGPAA